MKKIYWLPILFVILLLITFIPMKGYGADNGTFGIGSLNESEKSKIESFVEKQIRDGMIPGTSVIIVRNGDTIYQQSFGYSDVEKKRPMTSNSFFEIGSNSKAFTALAILKLQKDGRIQLEDSVTKYLPWFEVQYKGQKASITLEELLHHTSGVPFKSIDRIPSSNGENALEETVRTLVGTELDSEPGTAFQYATINYDVLGLIIEKVTGDTYEKYMEESILRPMGLNQTFLYRSEIKPLEMVMGYKIGFLKARTYNAPLYSGNKPAGYIMMSAEEMAKWLKIQLGTVAISPQYKELIADSHIPNRRVEPLGDGSSYGAGWFVFQKGGGEISHGGNNPNFSSYLILRPEEKVGIVVLANSNSKYTSVIAQGVEEILQGHTYTKDVKDLNKSADRIAVFFIIFSVIVLVGILFSGVKAARQALSKKRLFVRKGFRDLIKLVVSFLLMLGLSYCIYLIPYIIYRGVSWEFVFVWLPESVRVAVYSVYICIWAVYLYSIFVDCFRLKNDKSILFLSIMSIVTGFGNSLIIFTITMAINSSDEVRLKLIVYFALGLILYVYGQKLMRTKLIEVTNGIVYSKRMEILKCLLKAPFSEFEKIEKGAIQSTLNNDTETISRFANILVGGVTSTITLVCCFVYLGFINKYALLLSIAIILSIACIYYFAGIYANRVGEETRDIQDLFFKYINDLIGGFKELSLNRKRKDEFEVDLEDSCDEYREKRGDAALAFANMFVIGELLFTLAVGSIVLIFPLILKNMETTSIVSYVFILLYMSGPIHGILNTIPNAIEVRISFRRIEGLLHQMSGIEQKSTSQNSPIMNQRFRLKLKDVEYEYEKEDGRSFKIGPIDYEFKSGEITFITGGNGSGKSTLAKVLTGLYAPTSGHITMNDNLVERSVLNESYSAIFGDFHLFDRLYGIDYKEKTREIQECLGILQLTEKVSIEGGRFSTTRLSSGQKKRLALLVTYLEDRPIYLFDEWAADQDPEFRQFFYNSLLPELKESGKCIIAVTHDEHYFHMADKVIRMELGKLGSI